MTFQIAITLAAFVFIGWALMTQKIPGPIACMIGVVVLWFSGVLNETEVFSVFTSSSIISIISMMIICQGLMNTNILRVIASFVTKMKGGTILLLFSVMFITSTLVTFVGSQITAVITVIPLAMALAQYANLSPTVLVFPAVVGAQLTLFPIPAGPTAVMYMMTNQILESMGAKGDLNIWDSRLIPFVPSLFVMLFVMLIGWKLLPQRNLQKSEMLKDGGMDGLKESTLSKPREILMYIVFILTMVCLMISRKIGLSSMQICMAGALLTYIIGAVNGREFFQAINWQLVFMIGFMLSFITAVSNSGAGELLARLIQPVFGTGNLVLCCSVCFVFCIVLTQFMDNMGLMNILTPIVIAACVANNIPAAPVLFAVSTASVISFVTPMASPAGLFAYQLGGYSIKEMLRFGVPCAAIMTLVSCVWIPLYWTLFH